ncbi:coproporphyrinogen III oxidase [Bacteroidia bacterium]|nr:coproporphyrinogen III oxidase [Bacteroidia bacterium]
MAGIYIHIPFCQTRCVYCDFFSSTQQQEKEAYIELICKELREREDYLNGLLVETVYFGGGTPSQLPAKDFSKIFNSLYLFYSIIDRPEITLEANPDDITPDYLNGFIHLPFNRVSLGIQSFNDNELAFLNRRHNAESAVRAVELLQDFGFENISIDLMYGLPDQTLETWEATIQKALSLGVQHISAYHLTYEKGTQLHHLLETGKIQPVEEETSIQMFELLIDRLRDAGFDHYEISNFSRAGCFSRHNSAYWKGTPYLGIGASAHSYNGISRQWNRPVHGTRYAVHEAEIEILDERAVFNDFIITRLRTMKGINLSELQTLFGEEKKVECLVRAQKYLNSRQLQVSGNHLRLTRTGIFVSDGIMRDLIC